MYAEFETKTSYKYLQEVVAALDEPICILGGWAVFLHVNKDFQKAQGRPYLGSRDIDLGFHLDKNATMEQMENSPLYHSLDILQKKLKFKSVSFRLLKEIHTETEEEIGEGTIIPAHFIFPMYVDVLVDNIPQNFKRFFHFNPADEPLLRFVFENYLYGEEVKGFNKKLWLPKPELLLATKFNALQLRDKEHKKVKDICDIFALLWYTQQSPQQLVEKIIQFVPQKSFQRIISTIDKDDCQKAALQLGHSADEVRRVFESLS
ncbi:hypothetical protein HYY69_00885 [Candidatus Woesearchaeota archaeon]|nr:hypothetical protein [Candidatus Woesearchaeota archaeon]